MGKKKSRTKYVSKGQRSNVSSKILGEIKSERTGAERMANILRAAMRVPKDKMPKIAKENGWFSK